MQSSAVGSPGVVRKPVLSFKLEVSPAILRFGGGLLPYFPGGSSRFESAILADLARRNSASDNLRMVFSDIGWRPERISVRCVRDNPTNLQNAASLLKPPRWRRSLILAEKVASVYDFSCKVCSIWPISTACCTHHRPKRERNKYVFRASAPQRRRWESTAAIFTGSSLASGRDAR